MKDDNHIEFFWKKCQLCYHDYNFIGKMETFYKDSKFLVEKLGVNASLFKLNEIANVSSGPSTIDFARELFSKLPESLVLELYEMYRMDFDMFGYDPNVLI